MGHKVEMGGFAKFMKLSGQERQLFMEALIFQVWIGLLLKVIPFRWIPKLFKDKVQRTRNLPGGGHGPEPGTLEKIKIAIQRAALLSPWKNRCLVQSLAGRCMLNKRRITSQLSLGVAHGEGRRLLAHAWLKADDFEIVEKGGDYTGLYLF